MTITSHKLVNSNYDHDPSNYNAIHTILKGIGNLFMVSPLENTRSKSFL